MGINISDEKRQIDYINLSISSQEASGMSIISLNLLKTYERIQNVNKHKR